MGADRLLVVALTGTLGTAALARGGFTPMARALFIALAGVTLFAALAREEQATRRALRSAPVLTLLALGGLAIASAAWTVAEPDEAVRWGLVVVGYASLVVAAAAISFRPGGADWLVVAIASVTALTAALGLVGAALESEPWAQRIGGSWRAGGTLEYPPALALLQVSALPGLLTAMARGRGPSAAAGATGAALAAGVLALSVNRLTIALACLVMAMALIWPTHTLGAGRALAAAAVALIVVAGAAVHLIAGGYTPPRATGGDAGRLAGIALAIALSPLLWTIIRRRANPGALVAGPREPGRRAALATATVACAIAAVALALTTGPLGQASERLDEFSHGRVELWRATVETAADRPLLGTGAEGFLAGSAAHQTEPSPVRYAHSLPLEQGAELGIAGLLLVLALYWACGRELWRARRLAVSWLLGPAVTAFLLVNLVDWAWHLAGTGAVFAAALGGIIGARASQAPPLAGLLARRP